MSNHPESVDDIFDHSVMQTRRDTILYNLAMNSRQKPEMISVEVGAVLKTFAGRLYSAIGHHSLSCPDTAIMTWKSDFADAVMCMAVRDRKIMKAFNNTKIGLANIRNLSRLSDGIIEYSAVAFMSVFIQVLVLVRNSMDPRLLLLTQEETRVETLNVARDLMLATGVPFTVMDIEKTREAEKHGIDIHELLAKVAAAPMN